MKLKSDTEALVNKVVEQMGFDANAVASALLAEAIATFGTKGILF